MNPSHGTDWTPSQGPQDGSPAQVAGVAQAVGRHWVLVFTVAAAWCLAAAVHVAFAPREYTTTVKLSCEAQGPRFLPGDDRAPARSPAWLAQQCEVILAAPLLREAAGRLSAEDRACLEGSGDAVEHSLRRLYWIPLIVLDQVTPFKYCDRIFGEHLPVLLLKSVPIWAETKCDPAA